MNVSHARTVPKLLQVKVIKYIVLDHTQIIGFKCCTVWVQDTKKIIHQNISKDCLLLNKEFRTEKLRSESFLHANNIIG